MMRVLSPSETRAALPWDKLLAALEEGLKSSVTSPQRHHHTIDTGDSDAAVLLLMPAWRNHDWGGVKLVNVHTGNSGRGVPPVSSTYVLFDRITGEHRLIVDGGELTVRRTAAASALAARKLARRNARRHLIVGAGRVGSAIPYAYLSALDVEEFEIWSQRESRAKRLVGNLQANGHVASIASDLQAAVARADIITCATLARRPIVKGDWLRPGQHLDLIGSFTPETREADDTAVRRARIFVDTDHARIESGDIRTPLEKGVISERDIVATLPQLCRGDNEGRVSDDEITLFKSVGFAAEDLCAAILAMETVTANERHSPAETSPNETTPP